MPSNGDTLKVFNVGGVNVRGLGSFHKSLPHNQFGEVDAKAFDALVDACTGNGSGFASVPLVDAAPLINPQAGLAADKLTQHPAAYAMPPAPTVLSDSTAAEMTELYWMALLRDLPFNEWTGHADVIAAAAELDTRFKQAAADSSDPGALRGGRDLPGADGAVPSITSANLFRLGLPGEEIGPMLSQFFVRPVPYGTQTIDARQRPYKAGTDYLVDFPSWLDAQNSGRDAAGQDYGRANEDIAARFEPADSDRYVSTMRDLARFVNKDALHQAYFNGALLMLSGGAAWTPGNPYASGARLSAREAGFGVLGGPHIIALVAEVATRALKVVWNQKWQVNLRLRPEAYGGLLHVQEIGVGKMTRAYGLPSWLPATQAAGKVRNLHGTLLLPMAFTPGSPTHPAYGAGHATVAGACVTLLKAFFRLLDNDGLPLKFNTLLERDQPYGAKSKAKAYLTGRDSAGVWQRFPLSVSDEGALTMEGELNKLAQNVAMGRSMGGVHWRSDNSRSLLLGEAIAAEMLAQITTDTNEHPAFVFRSFARDANGQPKMVEIRGGRVYVDGVLHSTHFSKV